MSLLSERQLPDTVTRLILHQTNTFFMKSWKRVAYALGLTAEMVLPL